MVINFINSSKPKAFVFDGGNDILTNLMLKKY
jgi:hypothetical protein